LDLEEERRLFYVGMTRAKERLYITHCKSRFLCGKRISLNPSPFLEEIGEPWHEKKAVQKKKKPPKDKQMSLW